jgi:S-DNA-T family DNA segregation ATPase FtsK/SpoIIIE
MTYLLNTLNTSRTSAAPARSRLGRFAGELALLAGFFLLAFWGMALFSYSLQDLAWSTSGSGAPLANRAGSPGAWLADGSYFLLGYSVWWCFAAGLSVWFAGLSCWLREREWLMPQVASIALPSARLDRFVASRQAFWLGLVVLMCASATLEWTRFYSAEAYLPGHSGGILGYFLGPLSIQALGFSGSAVLAIILGVVGAALVFRFSWGQVAERLGGWFYFVLEARREKREVAQDVALGQQAARAREGDMTEERQAPVEPTPPSPPLSRTKTTEIVQPALAAAPVATVVAKAGTLVPRQEPPLRVQPKPVAPVDADNKLPQVDLLDSALQHQETVAPETLEMTSRMIEKKLKDFGVEVRVVLAQPGPVITRYEIEPATGVKGAQIVGLAKDLARSLSLVSIRVVETIPGKNYMALELPNAKRQSISLSEILGSHVYHEAKSMLTMGLGKDIVGNPVVVDLAKMPHVLVAGTTGSGKSVGINAMILSLLYKSEPRDVRLLMIDPKMLEMSVYEGIPHLLAPVVTDMRQAAHGLTWCVAEMERRYKLLSKMGVRNLAGYNFKIDEAKARGELVPNPFSLTPEEPEPLDRLPHIVVVIDELADLMMVVGKKIEELIARLAQKARAAGIHLILATQRPSVDVITGLIKANIPTRISFKVSSKIDSRTILDQMGAEALLGLGDMLYMPGSGMPTRVHGAFVSDEEVHRVVSYLKSQGEPNYIEGVLEGGTDDSVAELMGEGSSNSREKDPMYDQAVEVVLKNRKASISLVQRHLKIGYNRAARLVEDMENAGLVSSMSSSGQREILVPARAE